MIKLTHMKRERAKGILHATVTPLVVAKQFRCHVRMIERLKNRFQQNWTTSDRPRPGLPRVLTRRQDRDIQTSHLRNRFYLETVTARTYPGNHNPRISAQTVINRLQEIRLRPDLPTFDRAYVWCCIYVILRNPWQYWRLNELRNWQRAFSITIFQ